MHRLKQETQTLSCLPRRNMSFKIASASTLCALPPVICSPYCSAIPLLSGALFPFVSPQPLARLLPSFPLPFSTFPHTQLKRCRWVWCPSPIFCPFPEGWKSLPMLLCFSPTCKPAEELHCDIQLSLAELNVQTVNI